MLCAQINDVKRLPLAGLPVRRRTEIAELRHATTKNTANLKRLRIDQYSHRNAMDTV